MARNHARWQAGLITTTYWPVQASTLLTLRSATTWTIRPGLEPSLKPGRLQCRRPCYSLELGRVPTISIDQSPSLILQTDMLTPSLALTQPGRVLE
ncbi:hypothetical protein B0J15DRAFT_106070 [Fusarium solani]|uniref:Uncharacterized protein n=1 Tax=Fusarium solani TaxID=169388 RepID=A0A9P9RC64_FUSSL|nr:uncharacterized protein B0J15DRAFT_106070 [Fusarium solani]KAH7273622.1 hypothetical protein B0J15DRAFT_106070 [Fusarium solani]